MIEFKRATLETCSTAVGVVVVIDVLRAFSTAAYAFGYGAQSITLTSTVEEAFALKLKMPGAYLMGEVDGRHIPGFDFGNSPLELERIDLTGCQMIQRTSSGTQGVILSRSAQTIFAASFCVARATAEAIQRLTPQEVTFVITGLGKGKQGDEDIACADYIEALASGNRTDAASYLHRVADSPGGRLFSDPAWPEYTQAELQACMQADRFDFAMRVERRSGLAVMKAV